MISIISENTNITKDPYYYPIFISSKTSKLYHIYDKTMCHFDIKGVLCFDDNADLKPHKLPDKYKLTFQCQYDLNYLGDQDGEIEENCTTAHVKKISCIENFNFLECAKKNIEFDRILNMIIFELSNSDWSDKIDDNIDNIINIIQNFNNNENLIKNSTTMRHIDENSGQYNVTMRNTKDLHQQTVLPLDNNNIIDSIAIEIDKSSDTFGQITVSFKTTNIEMKITDSGSAGDPIDVNMPSCLDID
jgi:hypothetical protein